MCRCTGLCCGWALMPCQAGNQRTMQPARSRDSQTGSSAGPPDSSSNSGTRASSGHGVGMGGAWSPRLSAVMGDSTRPRWAASAPARRSSRGVLGLVSRSRPTSPWWTIRPCGAWVYSGRRSRRTKDSLRRTGSTCRAARLVRSTAWPIRRAAMLTARRRSSASAYSSRVATSSTSVASSRSIVRPELRWRASRTSSSCSYGSLTPECGRSVSQVAASARSMIMSRKPPRASFRSGSSR